MNGLFDVEAAKAMARERRSRAMPQQTGRDGHQRATGCHPNPAADPRPARPASSGKPAPDYRMLTGHWSTPVPTISLRFGPYLLLRSETDAVLFRRQSYGQWLRVRLAGSSHSRGFRCHSGGAPVQVRLRRLIGRIARAFRRPLQVADYGTTQVPEKPSPHSCPNPSTRPCVANRFRFSVSADAAAINNGERP